MLFRIEGYGQDDLCYHIMTEGVVVTQPPKAAPIQIASPVISAAPSLNGSASTSISAKSTPSKFKKINKVKKIKLPNAVYIAPRCRILTPNFYDLIDLAKFGSDSKQMTITLRGKTKNVTIRRSLRHI